MRFGECDIECSGVASIVVRSMIYRNDRRNGSSLERSDQNRIVSFPTSSRVMNSTEGGSQARELNTHLISYFVCSHHLSDDAVFYQS
jgi:hypothetical protein